MSASVPAEGRMARTRTVRSRQLIVVEKTKTKPGARLAEAAGEKAAECAAILCCCPCGLANLLVVAAVKLPAGLLRRALGRRRKHRASWGKKKAGRLRPPRVGSFADDDFSIHGGFLLAAADGAEEAWPAMAPSQELLELEKRMLASFYGAGFWRSLSQKE